MDNNPKGHCSVKFKNKFVNRSAKTGLIAFPKHFEKAIIPVFPDLNLFICLFIVLLISFHLEVTEVTMGMWVKSDMGKK